MGFFIFSFTFLAGGLILLYLAVFKYTRKDYEKEKEKNEWMKDHWAEGDTYQLFFTSYVLSKIVFITLSLILIIFGGFLLAVFFLG